jgi:hypothetical protein
MMLLRTSKHTAPRRGKRLLGQSKHYFLPRAGVLYFSEIAPEKRR